MKGTTTVGLVCKDGVVLGTERRATYYGGFIASKTAQKLFRIDDRIGATIAGGVGDAQSLIRTLRAEAALYRLRRTAPMTVEGATTLLSNILNGNRYFPYYVGMLVGGVDGNGHHLYSLDADGGAISDKFGSMGSGSTIAYGLLEEAYEDSLTLSEGADVALRALTAAMKRDANSGNGYLLATISEKEFHEHSEEEIKRRLGKLKIPVP
ncbi:MAG: archaeal proteasome endopeptidase complex subunit beta [Euryarchaeota archaeon]|nr:archaeal proteasome endopeptidase complex subunit beta [Euryarchaeota archaeon]MDE1837868.1 archaeal proteasome endopeptidase complex subunit beta [Euryarchaeota archaeon]MDE1881659.1 archaeal proteasome endopeptidase complex subunit beta [Euryarchaeota archaeon]MDE2046214.1 archaeal proteasome endopeptidase complex subunit beta [Thermoplasmata archaeon]